MATKIFTSHEFGIAPDALAVSASFQRRFLESILTKIVNSKDYGEETINDIGIIPTIFEQGLAESLGWEEIVKYRPAKKEYEARLHTPLEKYIAASEREKRQLILDNIVESLLRIKETKAKDYKVDELIKDFLEAVDQSDYFTREFNE